MDVNTKTVTSQANKAIQQSKVLPEKVTNTTFEENNRLKGITKEDLK